MSRLQHKRAVVTGGSNGIGRGIVEAFLDEGASVLFTTLSDTNGAQALVDAYPKAKVNFLQLDAAEASNVEILLHKAEDVLGQVDVLVNNAATITRTAFLDLTAAEYDRVMGVNTRFPFFATQAFARHMVEHDIKGSIINISSISAFKAISKMAHYQCSKAALSMLSKSAAFELASYGIRVNTISPGLTATKANRNQWEGAPEVWEARSEHIPMGRVGAARDHAGAAVFLASDESSWISGADLVIDGGVSAG